MDARLIPDYCMIFLEGLLLLGLIIGSFYQRKRNKKIAEMVAVVAAENKILRRCATLSDIFSD